MSDWLTYAQLGERLGLSAEAARHRSRRLKWRTQPGNDGRTLVLLPDNVEPIRPRPPVRAGVHTPTQATEIARLAGLLERADARAERAEAKTEQADADRRAAEARADRAEAALGAERTRADGLRGRLDTLTGELREARETAEGLRQAEMARQARGLLARLRAAWRGQ